MRSTLVDLLSDEGYDVAEVSSIAEARERIREVPNALLLLDSGPMPALGAEWLREIGGVDGVPCIILSASKGAAALGESFGVEVVVKPFDIHDLVARIARTTRAPSGR